MAKAAACLLPVSFTFHMAVEILHDLAELISMLEPGLHYTIRSTDQYSMPGNALTIATQLTASGLLQQLPAAVVQAEQQLQKLEPTGWCGGPCHFCVKGKRAAGRIPDFSDPSSAGRYPLQAFLLEFCSKLVSFWPGGALSSTALGPSLVPMAQLALSSLQYTTQQAQKHKPADRRPPGALPELGRTALDMCLALCAATAAATFSSGGADSSQGQGSPTPGNAPQDRSVSRLPHHSLELLLHPAMLSAAVAIACAAIYGEHVGNTVAGPTSSAARDSSSKMSMLTSGYRAIDQAGPAAFDNGLADELVKSVAPLLYLQESIGPDAELPAAAWQLLSSQEASLRPGQTLLPHLQQQLVDTLGCPGKGFLWLSPLWRVRQELQTHKIMSLAMQTRHVMESVRQMDSSLPHSGKCDVSGQSPPAVSSQELLQLLLLPTVPLRWVISMQGLLGTAHPIWATSMALYGAAESLVYWQLLADAAAEQQQQTSQQSSAKLSRRQKQASSSAVAVNEMPGPVLYEYLQLFVECLWGVLQHDSSGCSNAPASGSSSSSRGPESLAGLNSAGALVLFPNTPAAAAAKLATALLQLLPSATKLAVGAEHKGSSGSTTSSSAADGGSSSSSRGGREADTTSPSPAAGCQWAPLLLRMSAILEHGMRFEARHQATSTSSTAGQRSGGVYVDNGPHNRSLLATYTLLSTTGHRSTSGLRDRAGADAVASQLKADDGSTRQGCSLLRWLLETAAPQQQAAVQQQVFGLLTTAIKHTWAVKGGQCLTAITADVHKSIVKLVWSVLEKLHAPQPIPTPCTSSLRSSSTAGVHGAHDSDTTAATSEELHGTTTATSSSSSSSDSSTASCVTTVVPSYAAMVPWLVLLGRSVLQTSATMSEFLTHSYSDAAAHMRSLASAANTLQEIEETMLGKVTSVCAMALTSLPAAILSAAAMFCCDSQRQLPQQVPAVGMYGESTASGFEADLSGQQRQRLAALGQALSRHCSSMGIDFSAIQQNTWALAEASAAAMPLFQKVMACIIMTHDQDCMATLPMLPKPQQVLLLMEMGLGPQAATEAADSLPTGIGSFTVQQLAFVSLKFNPVIQSFLRQLSATGLALSSLPTAAACNNPRCTSLAGTSEKQAVEGKSCRCAACQLAYYCCRGCQRQHWDVHKPVCKAVQAKKAARPA